MYGIISLIIDIPRQVHSNDKTDILRFNLKILNSMCEPIVVRLVRKLSQGRENLNARDLDYLTSPYFRDPITWTTYRSHCIGYLQLTSILDSSQNDICLRLIEKIKVQRLPKCLSQEDRTLYYKTIRRLFRLLDEFYPIGSHLATTDKEKAWRSITDRTITDGWLTESMDILIRGYYHMFYLDHDERRIFIMSAESKENICKLFSTIDPSIPPNVWDEMINYTYRETNPIEML